MVRTAADAAADAMRAAVFGEAGVEERVLEEAAHQDSVFRDAVHSATPRSSARPGGEAGGSTPWPDLSTTARGGSPELGDFIEAAGLLEYDPAAITRIYAGHPQRLLRRLAQTLIPIGLYLLGVGTDWLLGMLANPERSRARARECANLLVDLGPAFIKAGQALSTRPDIVPPMLLEELAQLQDQLPGFDSALAMACIEEDLGAPVEAIYASLEREPISAASLGQVHRGVLRTGERVAVKVQRPGLREQITLDLYIVRNIAAWLNQNVRLIRSDLVGLIDELGRRVFEEMDYFHEAANADRFRALHAHNRLIAVPLIYHQATSRRVLTMQWIEGVKLTNLEAVQALGIDPDVMVSIGVDCSLQQLLEHGFFHADPHPGNLLALSDGRLAYLDFGMMSEVSREARTGLIQAVVHLVNRNFSALSKDFVSLGFLAEDVNLEPIVPAFESVFGQALEMGVSRMDFKAVTDDLSGVMYRFPFQVPPYYALIIRSLVTLEGIALSVDPDFKILGAAYPYFARRLMEDPDPSLRQSLKEMLFDGEIFRWQRLDNLIASASKGSQLDLDTLLDQVLDFLFSPQGGLLRQQLVDAVVERMDAVAWQATLRLGQRLPTRLQPPGLRRRDPWEASEPLLDLEPVRQLVLILRALPGFEPQLLLKRLPRLVGEPDLRRMGAQVARGLAERGVVRLLRDVLVAPQRSADLASA
ncbi:AarF/ABC1/UbiB kinase family protein [Synechococcus sp. CCY9201]|uniref:ABC1 kinase family protein n=1 Tax=unclassified Synechococcus TaxID=2626047 RepID=UPI001E514E51|nr:MULTISPECIES: AarF/ABC1/UbiB kinase family protein [unclassified Synechococcus]MEA5472701.1 AarF/ABC1/UbiB kinase family protein [Synechococcus sp. CCY9201]CAK6686851.1 protein kinase UbiB [Synechococcus sp. CBW1107]